MNHPLQPGARVQQEAVARRPHESAEAQIVFRHFARVLERLVPPPRGQDRPADPRRQH